VAAPRAEVIKGNGWRSRNNAIEITWKSLGGLEALSAASGASKVIRLVMSATIESFADLFANNDTSVDATNE
jgi:hypothetical protein